MTGDPKEVGPAAELGRLKLFVYAGRKFDWKGLELLKGLPFWRDVGVLLLKEPTAWLENRGGDEPNPLLKLKPLCTLGRRGRVGELLPAGINGEPYAASER